ncbi:hypothetical protein Tco_1507454 [Tanacetum coccineum]
MCLFCESSQPLILALQSSKSISTIEIGLGGCGIANLAHLLLGKVVEEGGVDCPWRWYRVKVWDIDNEFLKSVLIVTWNPTQIVDYAGANLDRKFTIGGHITAKVAGKPVSISEASIRSDLLFDDANGIDSLPNQAIFDAIQLMDKQLANVPVPLDHFPINALTSKVFSFMVKKGKHFSGKHTPLFASMLVQPTEDEGAPSERPSEAQPTPSPAHTSEVPIEPLTHSSPAHTSEVPIEPQTNPSPRPSPSTIIPDSIPESFWWESGVIPSSDKSLSGNEGEMTLQSVYDLCLSLCAQVLDQAKEIQHLKAQIKKLKKQAKPVIKHHRAWMQSVSLKQRFAQKRDPQETREAQDVGEGKRYSGEREGNDENIPITERCKIKVLWQIEGTDEQIEGTDEQRKDSDDHTREESATQTTQPPPTSTIFGDDETIAKVLLNMSQAKAVSREKEKGVELKDIERNNRPMPTSTISL